MKSLGISMAVISAVVVNLNAQAGETLNRVLEKKELVAVMDQSYPPFSLLNEKNEQDGFDVDVVKAVANKLGVKYKIETPSWEVVTAGHWQGRWDICICSMTPDDKKAKVLDFVTRYYSSPAVLVTTDKNSSIKSNNDIEGKKIAVEQGSSYERYLQKELNIGFGAKEVKYPFNSVNVVPYSSEELAYQDLSLGAGKRIDGIVSNLVSAQKRIKDKPGIYSVVGEPLYEEPNWVAVDKGDKEWNEKIKSIIKELKSDGTLKQISLKWIGSDITHD